MANGGDDMQDEEDEAVRCLCGSEDYPGPPPVDGPDADIFAGIELTDEVTGFFVQCDICKVWQHGACVGIFSAESSPDEYFCEQCRKDLHKIHSAASGQKYSKYLPLYRQSRATSRATSIAKDEKNTSKNSRPNTATHSSKRRSTMNSRDAAYDDEQLRRAIEASKEENVHDTVELATRRAKRGRSDSEEQARDLSATFKRQRTGSRSVSPILDKMASAEDNASDEDMAARNGAKKTRVSKPQSEKSEKDDKERQRLEAANKRKGRAERRRGDADSDLSEELPPVCAKTGLQNPPEPPSKEESPSNLQAPGTPPTTHSTVGSSHKRGGRSNRRGKGKNQYTKDRDLDEGSPARSVSRDIQKGDEATTTGHPKSSVTEHKSSKAKANPANKMSMVDMKRRVAAIMEFISRTQVDLATEAPLSQTSSGRQTPQETADTVQTNGDAVNGNHTSPSDGDRFRELNCMEMMDVLTRDMVKWQGHYA
ncbi:transcriptional regulator Cti6 [Moelleriella libera RCEF 2490]|uniref:Transcriptional regulator Cti6 n=1 Tax=Moelleriella libera RCEF 2490 TaxID=1081109 RepID=A0A167X5H2_9HYPO|nr:transcriptional regulator Cti6 [Moelleriella libera RCEF 2490]